MNAPLQAVLGFLDDGIKDDALIAKYHELCKDAESKNLATYVVVETFLDWFNANPGYDKRFPKIHTIIEERHKAHLETMESFFRILAKAGSL